MCAARLGSAGRSRPRLGACAPAPYSAVAWFLFNVRRAHQPSRLCVVCAALADRFDYALGPTSTQTEVYEQTNKPLVEKAVQGYNACCFAYGASKRRPRPSPSPFLNAYAADGASRAACAHATPRVSLVGLSRRLVLWPRRRPGCFSPRAHIFLLRAPVALPLRSRCAPVASAAAQPAPARRSQ